MKRKGFTLIELLAVIVILAIIAVITVPKIADMINSSRQGGAEDSFYGTLKAAELGYTKALQSNTNLKGSTCTITDSKITCTNGVKIDVSGKTPESGTLVIETDGSTMAKGLTLNGYKCYGELSTESPCVKADIDVASETLIKKVTTSGDGLYKDKYEDGRYIFRGSNPNNYLTFNDEEAGWRIVAVENDGTIKIISDEKVADKAFDSRASETTGPRLNNDNTYCRLWSDGNYYGCNAWSAINGTFVNNNYRGTVTKNSEINVYLNNEYYSSLTSTAKSKIQTHDFDLGILMWGTTPLNTKELERKATWNGNIALLNVSDWYKASTSLECTETSNNWGTGNTVCSVNNYLHKTTFWWWFISPSSRSPYEVVYAGRPGYVSHYGVYHTDGGVRPVMYLKSNLQLTGTGTSSDPYKILS